MKNIIAAPLFVASLLAAVSPAYAQDADESVPFHHPALIPHTSYAWPVHDDACEEAFRTHDATDVINACGKVVIEYKDLVKKLELADQGTLDPNELYYFKFNTAYSEMEVALAYKKLGSDDTNTTRSLDYATDAMNLAEETVQPIRDIPESDITDEDAAAIGLFDDLEVKIHEQFPDIPVPSGNAQADQ